MAPVERTGDEEGVGEATEASVVAVGMPVTPYVESMLVENVVDGDAVRATASAEACVCEYDAEGRLSCTVTMTEPETTDLMET